METDNIYKDTPVVQPSFSDNKPDAPVPQKSKNLFLIIALISALIVVFGTGGYILATRKTHQNSQISQRITQTPTIIPSSPTLTADSSINWKTYINTKQGYSLQYPSDWYLMSPGKDGDKSITIQNYLDSQITQQEAKTNSLNPNKMNIVIGMYGKTISPNQSLRDWYTASGYFVSDAVGAPTSIEDIIIASNQALKLHYQTGSVYVFINQKNVFYINFIPENSSLTTTFNQILSSLKSIN